MEYIDFEKALSKPRIGRFIIAARQDKKKALRIYLLNIELSKTLFGLLSIFEVTIRNFVDKHYREKFGDNEWLKNQKFMRTDRKELIKNRFSMSLTK